MPHRNYDAFFRDPDATDGMNCRVCGAICNVTRAQFGPASFVEAVSHHKRPHDLFICPLSRERWHMEALELLHEAEAEHDPLLIRALKLRLRRIVARYRPGAD